MFHYRGPANWSRDLLRGHDPIGLGAKEAVGRRRNPFLAVREGALVRSVEGMNRALRSPGWAIVPAPSFKKRPLAEAAHAKPDRARLDHRLKAILFDFGGTLDADGVPWRERFHALYRDEGLDLGAEAFAERFHHADDGMVGRLGPDVGFARTIELLVKRLERYLPAGRIGRGERVARRFHHEAEICLGRNRSCLERLARRFKLGIVSNFYGNLAAVAEETGIAGSFGSIVDSSVVGAVKPSPTIFRLALDGLGVTAADSLYVGDSLARDHAGAEATGITFVWVAAPDRAAPEGAGVRLRVSCVTALPDLLDSLDDAA